MTDRFNVTVGVMRSGHWIPLDMLADDEQMRIRRQLGQAYADMCWRIAEQRLLQAGKAG